MNYENYLNELKAKNPRVFHAKKISMAPQAFEAQIRRAYYRGFTDGADTRETKSLFEAIFGK